MTPDGRVLLATWIVGLIFCAAVAFTLYVGITGP